MTGKERRKCATCPASTTATLCRWCARANRKPAGSGVRVPVTLFSGSPEAARRRRTVLDAIDLAALTDREGWVPFLAWAERNGYEVAQGARDTVRGAAIRRWERLKVRLRSHGIDVETRFAEDHNSRNRANHRRPGEDTFAAFEATAMRFTVDGWDRLRALIQALDDWLCSVQEVA